MKRSEMIQKMIKEASRCRMFIHPTDHEFNMDKLLKMLEKEGMLPPAYKKYTPFSQTTHLKWESEEE
jgi:hypothetical protein